MASKRVKHLGLKSNAQIAALPVEYRRAGNMVVSSTDNTMRFYNGTAWKTITAP